MPGAKSAIEVAGVRLTSPDKVLYEEQGITKRELAEYYLAVADRILPHLQERLVTLIRCPSGRQKQCFVQRRAGSGIPRAVRRVEVQEEDETVQYLSVGSLDALLSLVQLGSLELHTWSARVDRLDRPDRLILDLDPDPALPFTAVVDAALEMRERLRELGLESFVKTTGGKGLHLVSPLNRRSDWDEVRRFARTIAEQMESRSPDRYVAEAAKVERSGKLYIDYLRNAFAASAVAAYSSRARAGATVSVPLDWSEVRPDLDPKAFTVRTVPDRLRRQKRDPWAGYGEVSQALTRGVWERLEG